METVGRQKTFIPLLMDRAYEDYLTRYTAVMLGFDPIVPPKSNRKRPWDYDKELYKLRNEIERLFRLIQGFRRVFCRFEKLDVMYIAFIQLALVFVSIK
jgi:transposase